MAGSHKPVDVDPEAQKRAEEMWNSFVSFGKAGIILVAVSLVGLLLFVY